MPQRTHHCSQQHQLPGRGAHVVHQREWNAILWYTLPYLLPSPPRVRCQSHPPFATSWKSHRAWSIQTRPWLESHRVRLQRTLSFPSHIRMGRGCAWRSRESGRRSRLYPCIPLLDPANETWGHCIYSSIRSNKNGWEMSIRYEITHMLGTDCLRWPTVCDPSTHPCTTSPRTTTHFQPPGK